MDLDYNSKIKEIRAYAKENKVPIMEEDGIKYLTSFIFKHNIKSILEIGSAIGYSAIVMASVDPNIHITTIERDQDRYLLALKNIKNFDLEDRITLIFGDALETKVEGEFDLIFIDAAKAQNMNFFNRFTPNLVEDGYVITDNMKFHGLVDKDESEIESRDLRQLVRKIKEYKKFLEESADYYTDFVDIGDGLAISRKNEVE